MEDRSEATARSAFWGRSPGLAAGCCLLMLVAGCALGPSTVARDRFELTTAIADSWKTQMLLNMVKLRYGDTPVFLDVSSVITQYAVETQVNVAASWAAPLGPAANILGLGGSGKYTDRPTVTYSPMTGEKFARSLMTHIPVNSLLSLIQTGYPIDLVFRLCTHSINGVQNRYGGGARARQADPEFYSLLERMRRVQRSGAIGLKVTKIDKDQAVALVFRAKTDPESLEDIQAIRGALGIDPQAEEFRVVYGTAASSSRELAILSRSIFEILVDLASYIEVPEAHITEKRVNPVSADAAGPLVRIHSARETPADAFVALPYQGYWFWIDNRDMPSKGLFSSLMLLFTLLETGGKEGAPVVTISAGG